MSDYGEQPGTEPIAPPPPPPTQAVPPPPSNIPPPPPAGAPVYGYPPAYPAAYPPAYPAAYPPSYPQPTYYAPPNPYAYPRDHPRAGLALGLGLGALIGGFVTLGLGFALGPFAWVIGQKARTEVRTSNGAYHSEGNATAGMVLGIIATAFLVLAVLFWTLAIIGIATDSSSGGGGTSALGLLTGRS